MCKGCTISSNVSSTVIILRTYCLLTTVLVSRPGAKGLCGGWPWTALVRPPSPADEEWVPVVKEGVWGDCWLDGYGYMPNPQELWSCVCHEWSITIRPGGGKLWPGCITWHMHRSRGMSLGGIRICKWLKLLRMPKSDTCGVKLRQWLLK